MFSSYLVFLYTLNSLGHLFKQILIHKILRFYAKNKLIFEQKIKNFFRHSDQRPAYGKYRIGNRPFVRYND